MRTCAGNAARCAVAAAPAPAGAALASLLPPAAALEEVVSELAPASLALDASPRARLSGGVSGASGAPAGRLSAALLAPLPGAAAPLEETSEPEPDASPARSESDSSCLAGAAAGGRVPLLSSGAGELLPGGVTASLASSSRGTDGSASWKVASTPFSVRKNTSSMQSAWFLSTSTWRVHCPPQQSPKSSALPFSTARASSVAAPRMLARTSRRRVCAGCTRFSTMMVSS